MLVKEEELGVLLVNNSIKTAEETEPNIPYI